MTRYTVELEESVIYSVDVEADSYEEAEVKAISKWVDSEDPFNDFCGFGQGVTCIGVAQLED